MIMGLVRQPRQYFNFARPRITPRPLSPLGPTPIPKKLLHLPSRIDVIIEKCMHYRSPPPQKKKRKIRGAPVPHLPSHMHLACPSRLTFDEIKGLHGGLEVLRLTEYEQNTYCRWK